MAFRSCPNSLVKLSVTERVDPVERRVDGRIVCDGENSPIQFLPEVPDLPWGQIDHRPGSSAEYKNTFFIRGGGNPNRAFGHSGSQPVLGGEECSITAENIVIMDCPGKAFGLLRSEVTISKSLITRCDTGGEFIETLSTIKHSHFLDIPDADHAIDDDDNDCLYFHYLWHGGDDFSLVEHCVIMTGEDDGIDHNRANLHISDCVIADMFHEGVAASGENRAEVINTLVTDCEQGIECGWGVAQVSVDHCVLLRNEIGLRLGDSYDWGCLGTLNVSNSIVVNSDSLNIWNYDYAIEGPRENAIGITYSIVNQEEFNSAEGCLIGIPILNNDFTIQMSTVGSLAASDGLNMGLLPFEEN